MWSEEKKKTVDKNQGWEPIQQKYKANKKTSGHNPKRKQKQNNQQKSGEDLMHEGTHGYEVTIDNNKENLKQKSCHLLQIPLWEGYNLLGSYVLKIIQCWTSVACTI
jgi:hypothetical protein